MKTTGAIVDLLDTLKTYETLTQLVLKSLFSTQPIETQLKQFAAAHHSVILTVNDEVYGIEEVSLNPPTGMGESWEHNVVCTDLLGASIGFANLQAGN
jgi:hypothetical protein